MKQYRKINLVKIMLATFLIATGTFSCADMNDNIKEFLDRGETVYIGKVDSVISCPGDGRHLLKYLISDPRAKHLVVYWGVNNSKSKKVAIPAHTQEEAMDIVFEGSDALAEGNYTFQIISFDDKGNKSMTVEKIATVYGESYKQKLLNRRITETEVDAINNNLTLFLSNASSSDEIGVEMTYTDMSGKTVNDYYPAPGANITLTGVDISKGLFYQTLYLPEATAIDTFRTALKRIPVVKITRTNLALNKPVTPSTTNNPGDPLQTANNAVDGDIGPATTSGRWLSHSSDSKPWLEIDLQGEYSISSFKTYNGANGAYGYALSSMRLQVWKNDAWMDVHSVTGNTDPQYGADFAPVSTTKVRFEADSQIRFFEIEVYSVTTEEY
jgi:hypothetical protein